MTHSQANGLISARRSGVVGSGGFSPASISGLQGWWDASQLTGLADGDPVASLPDLSGNNRTLAQATSSQRPTYRTAALGGRPVVRFDGIDDSLVASVPDIPAPFSVFVVASSTAIDTSFRVAFSGNPSSGATYQTSGEWRVYNGSVVGSGISITAGGHVLDYGFSSASAPEYVDGVPGGSSNAGTQSLGNTWQMGRNSTASDYWQGDIAELLIWNSVLSSVNRQSVEAYLKAKWGTP